MKRNNKRRVKMVIFIFGVLMVYTFFTSFQVGKKQIETYELEVNSNDTIWNIANTICKNNDNLNVQNVVLEIKDINNLSTSDIYVGQTLNIPIY